MRRSSATSSGAGLEYQYEEHQFQESKGCAKDLKVSKVVVHDKWTRTPVANDIALLWLAEDVPDCLIETGEVREHCESYVGTGESPPCWPEKVKKRYSPIVAVDSPTPDFANYALENDAQTGKVFAMGYGLEEKGSGSTSTLGPDVQASIHTNHDLRDRTLRGGGGLWLLLRPD